MPDNYMDPSVYFAAMGGVPPPEQPADPAQAYAAALGAAPQNYIADYAASPHAVPGMDADRNNIPGTPEYAMAHPNGWGDAMSTDMANAATAAREQIARRGDTNTGQSVREALNPNSSLVALTPTVAPSAAAPTAKASMDQAGAGGGPASVAVKLATGGIAPRRQGGPGNSEYDKAIKAQQDAMLEGARVGAAKAAEESTYAQQKIQSTEQMQAQQLAAENKRQGLYDQQIRAFDQAQAEFQKINTTVDPHRYWADRGAGSKVLATIGVFLSGMGGQGQQALANIHQAIDRDIDAQKASIQGNLEKGKQGVQGRLTMLGIYKDKFGDERQAESAARATMLESTAAKMEAVASRYKAPEIMAQAKMGALQLRTQAEEEKKKFGLTAQEIAIKQQLADQEGMKTKLEYAEKMAALSGKGRGSNENLVPNVAGSGQHLYALDKEAAKTAREANAEYIGADRILGELIKIRKDKGAEVLDRSAVNKARSLASQYTTAYNKSNHLGALDEGTQKLMAGILGGDPTSIGEVLPVLEQLKQQQDAAFRGKMSAYLDPESVGSSARLDIQPLRR